MFTLRKNAVKNTTVLIMACGADLMMAVVVEVTSVVVVQLVLPCKLLFSPKFCHVQEIEPESKPLLQPELLLFQDEQGCILGQAVVLSPWSPKVILGDLSAPGK